MNIIRTSPTRKVLPYSEYHSGRWRYRRDKPKRMCNGKRGRWVVTFERGKSEAELAEQVAALAAYHDQLIRDYQP